MNSVKTIGNVMIKDIVSVDVFKNSRFAQKTYCHVETYSTGVCEASSAGNPLVGCKN